MVRIIEKWISNRIANTIQNGISKTTFLIVLTMFIFAPVIMKSKLIIFGERTYGEVIDYKYDNFNKQKYYFSKVEFDAHDTKMIIWSGADVIISRGEKIKIAYDKKKPSNCMIVKMSNIYSKLKLISLGVLILVWVIAYCSFRKK